MIDFNRLFRIYIFACLFAEPGSAVSNSSNTLSQLSRTQVGNLLPYLPLKTNGRYIVDAKGARVRLRCASWSGAQEKWYVPSGLWAQHRSIIAIKAKEIGLNCIRMVWSVEMALRAANFTAVVPKDALRANPDLIGKNPLQVFDAVIAAIIKQGLMVILDNHSSDAMWCCGLDDGNGMWYTAHWTEQQWLDSWRIMAQRYANNSAVVGMGLRNEPRPTFINGVLRVPGWGLGGPQTDLALAYEKGAAAVLDHKPEALIFAQGLLAGRDLRGVRSRPLVLRSAWPAGPVVSNQLVYEVHEYPYLWGGFDFTNYAGYASRLDDAWGYIAQTGTAPIWVGEFGIEHTPVGLNSSWWKAATRYIKENDLDWSYWPLDGQMGPSRKLGAEESYGLLNMTWDGYAHLPLIQALRSL